MRPNPFPLPPPQLGKWWAAPAVSHYARRAAEVGGGCWQADKEQGVYQTSLPLAAPLISRTAFLKVLSE